MEPVPESHNTMCRLLHLWLMLVATGGVEPVPESPRTLRRLATFCRCLLLPLVMWNQYQNFVSVCHLLSMSAFGTGGVEPVPQSKLSVGLLPSVDVCCCQRRCGTSTRRISWHFVSALPSSVDACSCHWQCGIRTRTSQNFESTLPPSVDACSCHRRVETKRGQSRTQRCMPVKHFADALLRVGGGGETPFIPTAIRTYKQQEGR